MRVLSSTDLAAATDLSKEAPSLAAFAAAITANPRPIEA